jgi:glycosyltransferase involved in cell wall biosynthesis
VEVVHITRKPREGQFSIERVFDVVRRQLAAKVRCRVVHCPFSGGLFGRIRNALHARAQGGEINHITGDVHYVALALAPASTVLTIHDAAALTRMRGLRRTLYKLLWFDWPARRSAIITTISETTKRMLVEEMGLPAEKIIVIPDCISDDFKPDPKTALNEIPVVLQIGTKKNKNLLRLAEALRGIPCLLEVVGRLSAEQKEALRDVPHRNSWDLSQEQLIQKYRDCDILAFVSTVEGFGMPIIEAQTVGRPVLASNVSSMPEVAGEGACYVDPLSGESIRAGLLRLIKDSAYRESLIRQGFRNAERFSAGKAAQAYEQVYRRIADTGQATGRVQAA